MKETQLNGESLNIVSDNIEKMKQLFPEIITEDKIDFNKLKEILGKNVEESDERYNFTWPGKTEALRESQKSSTGTLNPCKEDSKNWDSTQNLYIEGDNLEVLKILQKSYYNKVKMIYIDPPYNTGNDILYKNDYKDPIKYYKKITNQVDSKNNNLFINTENNGRFHSNWLNSIYPTLKLGKNLLSDDGIIIIAIDDYEQCRLKLICDEIFGEENFIGTIITKCNPQGRGKLNLDPVHEYHIIYAKSKEKMSDLKIKKELNDNNAYQTFLRSGTNSRKNERPYRFYPMLVKDNNVSTILPDEYNQIYENGKFNNVYLNKLKFKYENLNYEFILPISHNGEEKVWQRKYERALKECSSYIYDNGTIKTPKNNFRTPVTLWDDPKYSNVMYGTNLLKKLFGNTCYFDYPKSLYTVSDLISLSNEGIILDFFSGSGTTAHAVFLQNNENNEKRTFILVQIPEQLNKKSEAYNKGYTNICDISIDRIQKAGEKILEESGNKDLDVGFKVFKLDSSNLTKWNPDYDNLEESLLSSENNIISGRSELDLVYEVMLKYGIDLSVPVDEIEIDGKKVFNVGFGALFVCLDDNLTVSIADVLVDLIKDSDSGVTRVVFKDNGFSSDSDKANVKETLRASNVDEFITI